MLDPSSKPATPQQAVVMVHGLWMGGWVFGLLAQHLKQDGLPALAFSYPSMRETLSQNAQRLARFTAGLHVPTIHFVGHSLGGLLVLKTLLDHPEQRPGRVVMLGSPFKDSYAARRLASSDIGKTLLGKSLLEWMQAGEPIRCPAREIGVIAGSRNIGMGQIVVPGLPHPNDGTVTVEETRVTGATDHIVLPVSHSGMLLSLRVANQVSAFLKQGQFIHTAALT